MDNTTSNSSTSSRAAELAEALTGTAEARSEVRGIIAAVAGALSQNGHGNSGGNNGDDGGGGEGNGNGNGSENSGDGSQRNRGPLAVTHPGNPIGTARVIERECWTGDDGLLRLRRWRGSFWRHAGTHWNEASDEDVRSELWLLLEHAVYLEIDEHENPSFTPWHPTRSNIANVLEAAEAIIKVSGETGLGSWLGSRNGKPAGFISCRNTLVNPFTGDLEPHSASFFNSYSLSFEYDEGAQCSEWLKFLASVFPDDQESTRLLQEWFGYVISGRTDMQKMMFMKGAMRSGKGVIARILTLLLGKENVAGPTFDSFGEGFGLETLVSAQLAVVGDARSSTDRRTMRSAVSRLLSITGEDALDINRKYKPVWSGRLPTRVMLMSNELPWFSDASTAIVSRILLLVFTESFLGREDIELEKRLITELPGVFNWAMDGYRQLCNRGRFTEPASSQQALGDYRDKVSPLAAFLTTRCRQGAGLQDSAGFIYQQWVIYCTEKDLKPGAVNWFLSKVQEVWPKVRRSSHRGDDPRNPGQRVSLWDGIYYDGVPDSEQ